MAIEKMVLLNLVGSLEEEHAILEQLVLCENIHLNIDGGEIHDNSYIIHQYETTIPQGELIKVENYGEMRNTYNELEQILAEVSSGLRIKPELDYSKEMRNYTIAGVDTDLKELKTRIGEKVVSINSLSKKVEQLEGFRKKVKGITNSDINFNQLRNLNYFEYEIGLLSRENKLQIRKNYENISAIVIQIGNIEDSREDMYLVLYPKQYKEETDRLLKSLNWVEIQVPKDLEGNIAEILVLIDKKIAQLLKEIKQLEVAIQENKEETHLLLNRIFTRIQLEQRILDIKQEIMHGNNLFVLNAWVRKKERKKVEEKIGDITDKFVIIAKETKELDRKVIAPTKMKNNWFVRPFETIVKLYGLPSYNEIDPTPFLALTFCLMFGIMFGDIGQGLVYFLVGVALYKKNEVAGGILTRLGGSSILFGFVYGSLFGLEHEQLPWLPSLIGSPLSTTNIPLILITGVVLGVLVLSISFLMGIYNALKNDNIEEGLFGKNGITGYVFYLGLILTAVSIVGVIPVSPFVFLGIMVIALIVMVFKEPLANIIMKKKPYIHGDKSSYFVESGFEGVETILNALSNAISFIRVGAFALNHAGLFLAFLVMSDMTSNVVLKVIILILGNLLILTLEGLVVFIQGLRLQYYEMFSKYFKGDGIEYKPIKLEQSK